MIVARIQGHPSRAHLHSDLSKALSPLPTELRLHGSDPPDPWAGYRGCLSDLPRECSHVLVIQDDAQPVPHFATAVELIAERQPSLPVCLFLGGAPADTAARARRAWGRKVYIPLGRTPFVPLVCVLWPVRKATEFLRWAERSPRITRADDGNAARWARATTQSFLVSVPSLVQHNDAEPSVKGGRAHTPWKEKWRQAALLADDALDYEW